MPHASCIEDACPRYPFLLRTPLEGEAALDLVLSSAQQQRFAGVLQTLLSPLSYPSALEWRSAVTGSLVQLLDADLVTFRVPGGEPDLVSSNFGPGAVHSFADTTRVSEQRVVLDEYVLDLGAFNRGLLLRRQPPVAHEDECKCGCIVVDDALDWVALTAEMPADQGIRRVASIVLHRDPTAGGAFGNLGLTLLRLLVPVFRAGIVTYCGMIRERVAIGGIIDRLADGLLLCDADGNDIHESTALTTMLSDEPDAVSLRAQMRRVAHALVVRRSTGERDGAKDTDLVDVIRTDRACYRLRGTIVGDGVASPAVRIIVALEQLSRPLPGEAYLRERFGLTPREATVCLLLARRKTNEEIAGALSISRYTARRHTEKVLRKLRVKSRVEIAPTLLQGAADRQATHS